MGRMLSSICFAFALCAIAGCGRSSVDVAAQVKKEMQAELVKKVGFKALVVEEVVLVKERADGIEYTGVATGNVDGEAVKFNVKCKHDGHSLVWNAELSEGSMAALVAKEKTKEACAKIKESWLGFKEAAKQASDAVVKQASDTGAAVADAAVETYDAAKKKASELPAAAGR